MSIVVIGCPDDCGVEGELVLFEGRAWFACHLHGTRWEAGNLASPISDAKVMDLTGYRIIIDPALD